jgi:hypothetical protein
VSDHEDVDRRRTLPWPGGRLLTPGATAVSAFAFAVLSMQGQGTWSQALETVFWNSGNFPASQVPFVFGVWAFATLLLAVVAWLLAVQTLRDGAAAASWEGHLARAAMIVAAAGAVLSVLGVLAGAVRGLV